MFKNYRNISQVYFKYWNIVLKKSYCIMTTFCEKLCIKYGFNFS